MRLFKKAPAQRGFFSLWFLRVTIYGLLRLHAPARRAYSKARRGRRSRAGRHTGLPRVRGDGLRGLRDAGAPGRAALIPRLRARPRPSLLGPVPRALKHELTGTPRQFVCDADPNIEAAIREVWPPDQPGAPEVFLCHHHLHGRLLLAVGRQFPAEHPIHVAARSAFTNTGTWERFTQMVDEFQPHRRANHVRNWLRHNRARVGYQLAHRAGHVTDTTAIEQYLSILRAQIGLRRACLRNRERLDRMLMLMMLQQRQPASRAAYSHVIREHLGGREGKPPHQRTVDDRDPRG